jgi:hypothetical protein
MASPLSRVRAVVMVCVEVAVMLAGALPAAVVMLSDLCFTPSQLTRPYFPM